MDNSPKVLKVKKRLLLSKEVFISPEATSFAKLKVCIFVFPADVVESMVDESG